MAAAGTAAADTAAARFPRVLYLILSCYANRHRTRAILEGWVREALPGDRMLILGDDSLVDEFPDAPIFPAVTAGSPQDTYAALPYKVLAGLRHARSLPDWDFIFKCDDDTFAWPPRISAILAEHDPSVPMYLGNAGWSVRVSETRALTPGEWDESFPFFPGGGGYALSRPALEQAWPRLEEELSAPGAEDVLLGLAMYRGGVETCSHGFRVCHGPNAELVVYGSYATVHAIAAAQQPLLYLLLTGLAARPFEAALVQVEWGDAGFFGVLGYDHVDAQVAGQKVFHTLSAHPNSEILLRSTPGVSFRFQGALNDSSGCSKAVQLDFSIRRRAGQPIARLGGIVRDGRTRPAIIQVPEDGAFELVCTTNEVAGCHAIWLWSLDPHSLPVQPPFRNPA